MKQKHTYVAKGCSICLVGPSGDQPSSVNGKRGDSQVTAHLATTAVVQQHCSKDTEAAGDTVRSRTFPELGRSHWWDVWMVEAYESQWGVKTFWDHHVIFWIKNLWNWNCCFIGTIDVGQLRLKNQLWLRRDQHQRWNLLGRFPQGQHTDAVVPSRTQLNLHLTTKLGNV